MEGKGNNNNQAAVKTKNGEVTSENDLSLTKVNQQIENHEFIWAETLTVIDLSARNISTFGENVSLPANLANLNLSHNKLSEVPNVVLKLKKLVILNLSYNSITYFDECPEFCHTLEHLDISYNLLAGPPYWIWAETPRNLTKLNLSKNDTITNSFINGYFEELLQYKTTVKEVDVHNCRLTKFRELLGTFSNANTLCLGAEEYGVHANNLIEIPCPGLDKCCDLKSLHLCNTHVYTINPSIEMYKHLVEINLAQNDLNGLPTEFCNLDSLETCILSSNKIITLPEDMYKMLKLQRLYLDSNVLCMVPEKLTQLPCLRTLDLYDNNLNEVPNFENLEELDVAQNYCEEPDNNAYLEKKGKLRLLRENRFSGRKNIDSSSTDDEDEHSEDSMSDDEEIYDILFNGKKIDSTSNNGPPSSPEDWDSDEYWVPGPVNPFPLTISPWLRFGEQNLCNPQVFHEEEGQFDDYSSDDT